MTADYLGAAYGGRQGCVQAQAQASAAKSLRIKDVKEVDGATPPHATVRVVPIGGVYDGEKLTVSLVKEDGGWKVDSLKSNAPVGP